MAKKRKKIDDFLHSRKQSQAAVLEEKTRLSNRIFRFCVGFVVILLLLVLVEPETIATALGFGLLFVMLTGIGIYTVNRLNPNLFQGVASFNQFVFLILATVCLYKIILSLGWSAYLAPVPILGMVLGMAYSQVVGVLVVVAVAFYLALLGTGPATPGIERIDFLVNFPRIDFPMAISFSLGGVVSVLGVARIRRQSRPVIVGFYCGLLHAAAIICFEMAKPAFSFQEVVPLVAGPSPAVLEHAGAGFLSGVISGGVVTSILPAIERMLGVVTERRLLDLADPSNKLLRVLRERAPGTFQHTLGVQQLARNAAEAIGADVLLTEVGAYYHDIGKIDKPGYFVENMGEDKTIHDSLRPSMSKMIIISHVKDGILMGREERLPDKIIDMIPMHHGTTVVEFFYRKARKESGEEEAPGEDVEYRYPGPKPRFAEAGILMLADAVEAIAKTIAEPTSNRFRDMVRDVIMNRLRDGQLDECNLTIADLRKVEDSFVRTLTNMYHSRIDYSAAEDSPGPGPAAGGRSEGAKVGEPIKGLKAL